MRFAWDEGVLGTGLFVFSIVFIALVIVGLFVLYWRVIKRKVAYISLGVSSLLFVLAFLFYSVPAMIISGAVLTAAVTITLFTNLGDFRKFLANPFKKSGIKIALKNSLINIPEDLSIGY